MIVSIAVSGLLIYLYGEKEEEGFTFILFSLIGLLLVIFVFLPIAELFYTSLPDIERAIDDPNAISSIITSISAALTATIIGLLLGIPLAYVIARRNFPGKEFVEGIIDLPMVVPHTVAGIALLVVFGRNGSIGEPLNKAGIDFVDAFPGIVIAMLFVSIPFIINQLREGFESIDPRLEKVAMSLGANRITTFLTVSLPLIKRNIFSGAVMGWARAISEFGAVVIIAYYPVSAPVYIYDTFLRRGLFAARPIATLLLLVSLTAFIILRTITRRMGSYGKD
ncbi:MAG: ABC transporter permease subunit [Thermoplasmatota archaeon]